PRPPSPAAARRRSASSCPTRPSATRGPGAESGIACLPPSLGERAAVEQSERYGDQDENGFVERAGDRQQTERRSPSERPRDSFVGCSDLHRAKGAAEKRDRPSHPPSVALS